MIVTICVTIFLSLLALHVALRYNKARRLINKIPGPTPLPFFGNMLMFNLSTSDQMWSVMSHLLDQYYPILRVNAFIRNIVFLRHPEDLKILSSCKNNIEKAESVYNAMKSIDGLVMNGGEKWQKRRKLLNPTFNPHLLKVYVEIANEHAEKFVENMKNQNHNLIPDLIEVMDTLAMHIICEAVMDSDSNICDTEKAEAFKVGVREVSEIAYYRGLRPYITDWMMRFLSIGRRAEHHFNNIHKFSGKVIQERREYHKKTGYRYLQNEGGDDDVSAAPRKRLALLDLLLAAEIDGLIDEKGITEEVETMMIAGFETTGATLTFALMLFAENEEAQDLARAEVTEMMNQTEGVLTIANLNKLNYLDRCIREALRLFPSAPLIGRRITHEIQLSKYKLPVGTEVGMNFFALHRDPNFWPNPEKFDPDRFLPENVKERHPFAYLPFSAGPRSCIGSKFAMLEAKSVVARILYNFYLEPVESSANVKFSVHFSLKPTAPCRIKLIKINRK